MIPLLDATNDTVTKLDDEICHVSKSIILAADNLLPKVKQGKRSRKDYFKDDHLRELCNASKAAWGVWQQAGRPREGKLWENWKAAKKEVQKRLNTLRARRTDSKVKSWMTNSGKRTAGDSNCPGLALLKD